MEIVTFATNKSKRGVVHLLRAPDPDVRFAVGPGKVVSCQSRGRLN